MLLKPGMMFGDFRVVRLVGRGGMSEVWLLEVESRHDLIAVKLLDTEKANDFVLRKRFLSEAKLAMEIDHPNVVKVYDIGEDPITRLCYILMEYVAGGTLADRIARDGRIPFAEAVALVRDLALLLVRAKAKGIVHRDLKPANIMFAEDGSFRLADLGSVRDNRIKPGPGFTPELTARIGSFVGTPAYMAPEQMVDPRGVDTRADIYSLGVTFFEMLTGRRPYPDLSSVQIMAKAVTGEPIPDVRTVDPSVPAVIANVIRAMCEPNRETRIDSPQWIADCCDRVLERL